MALTKKQLQDVCCLWKQSGQCRYLDSDIDSNGDSVHVCQKKSPQKKIIDEEVREFLIECRNKSQDPRKTGVPLGDNCSGYIKLTTKLQGYDLP